MSLFIFGLIVGIIATNLAFVFVLGLCKAAARGDDAMETALQKLETEARERVHITGGGK